MWRQVCFVQTRILIKTNHWSIWCPGQSSFFSLVVFYTYFLNLPFWTKLCCDHLSLYDRRRCITYFPYAVSHQVRGIQVSLFSQTCIEMSISKYAFTGTPKYQWIFFSWVRGGLRCHMRGCTRKMLVGPCAVFQSWFSVCSMCLSASILGISGRIEHTTIYVSQDIQNGPRSGVWLLCVAWNYDVL